MAKVTVHVTDCVVAELEKLGPKYRVALRIAQQLGKYFFDERILDSDFVS